MKKRTVYFAVRNPEADVIGQSVNQQADTLSFVAEAGEVTIPVTLNMEGEHYVHDALAAIAVGFELQISPEKIRQSLARFRNMDGRQQIYERNGFTIIEDCYNAGPESMAAALAVLGNRSGRRIAVLGDMLELGVCSDAEHYKVGRIAAEKAEVLLAYGDRSLRLVYGAVTGGMSQNAARAFTDKDKLVQVLKGMAKPGDVILFKGSRGMRMEEVLEKFLEEEK